MKDWNSPVYAFFDLTPQILKIDGCHTHDFKCQARNCKTKVQQYLDKGDACSTMLKAAAEAKDANEVSITMSFECKGKGKVTYSHHQHTCAETRAKIVCWVSESLCPFNIIKDCAFQSLMKTGRPKHYIPSPSTISCDVQQVFVQTQQCVAIMLQVSNFH
ncbi:hypothetical protein BDR04DRAFT_1129220 [Suillus decipiens]|nr:hypothetical protein BDR04DRAFT_1129220 [Suillus decipiens]